MVLPPARRHQREAHDPVLRQLDLVGAVWELRRERADDQPVLSIELCEGTPLHACVKQPVRSPQSALPGSADAGA